MQVKVPEVSGKKAKAETMMNRMHSTLEEEHRPMEKKVELKYVHSTKAEAKMDKWQSAQDEAVRLKKEEQGLEEKMDKVEMDLEANRLLAVELIENRSKEYFAEAAEQLDFKKLMLRQLNLNTKEVEKHADAKQLNYMMKAETEAKENRMQLKKVEQSLKVEMDWQGSALLVIKQDLVEMSLSKKVEMKLMHALKAEAVQVRNMEQKLMQEEFLKFCKQYLMVEECEKEGHEALQLQVDKQAAAAG